MEKSKRRVPKWLKLILIIASVMALAFIAFIIALAYLLLGLSDHTELYGDIHIIGEERTVGKPIVMVFDPPEELQDIYRLMWDIDYDETSGDQQDKDDAEPDNTLYEEDQLLEVYDEATLMKMYNTETMDLEHWAVFIPQEPGDYVVYLSGFYKQTNPQGITLIKFQITE